MKMPEQNNSHTLAGPDAGEKIPLLGMNPDDLKAVAAENGLKPFQARQIARWLYVARVTDIADMTDLSKEARRRLALRYTVGREEPKAAARSKDGTVKYLFEGRGGRDVEAVYIPDRDRATLCISSQAGCKMGCRFCMTGRQGFHGSLTSAQIINQVLSVENSESLTNIVFMGMGEPTDNLDAVLRAVDILTAPWGLAWSPKRITVSTIGNIPALRRLIKETRVHLALSLHSPFGAEREGIMPVERVWPVRKVLETLAEGDFAHQRRLSLEYIVFRGLNDDERHSQALVRLLDDTALRHDVRVNLIRFHAIPDAPFRSSSDAAIEAFRDRLNDAGVTATIRASRGEDIMAACGQLAGRARTHLQAPSAQ